MIFGFHPFDVIPVPQTRRWRFKWVGHITVKKCVPLKLAAKAPENGWLEYDPFLSGSSIFRGSVSFKEGMFFSMSLIYSFDPGGALEL